MKMIIALFIIVSSITLHAKTIEIMSYNVENLFDAKHDEGKADWSFLPKDTAGKTEACNKERSKFRRQECYHADWTDEKVEIKISQIVDVITKERNGLPDILGLVEVENGEVVGRLAKKLGYEHFEITNSPDNRGVDVALLFKINDDIKKISRTEHHVDVDYPTRNILEVEFTIAGHPLTVFVNHWPSLANPSSWRVKAANVLANRTKELMAKNPNMAVIALGDFNTIDDNDPHPFKTVLHKDNLFLDAAESFKSDKTISDEKKKTLAEGTYYYPPKDQWNMLDRIFYNNVLAEGKNLKLDISTFEIYLPNFALEENKSKSRRGDDEGGDLKVKLTPKRFDTSAKTKEKMGYSDHYAVVIKMNYPEKAVVPVKEVKKTPAKKK